MNVGVKLGITAAAAIAGGALGGRVGSNGDAGPGIGIGLAGVGAALGLFAAPKGPAGPVVAVAAAAVGYLLGSLPLAPGDAADGARRLAPQDPDARPPGGGFTQRELREVGGLGRGLQRWEPEAQRTPDPRL